MGRGGAGGEDRNVCSIWNGSPGTRKPSGKHPLDGESFLNKNKEQRAHKGVACTVLGTGTMPLCIVEFGYTKDGSLETLKLLDL